MNILIVDTPCGPIEYSDHGEGEPILVLHGGHGNCKENLMFKGLSTKKYRFITPSRPGYGATPLSGGETHAQAAQKIVSLMDHLDIEHFSLFGISAGGPTAIEIAASEPARVKKLLLASAITKQWMTNKDKLYKKAQKLFHPRLEKYTWAMFRLSFRLAPKALSKVMIAELSTVESPQIKASEREELWTLTKNQRSGEGFLNDLRQQTSKDRTNDITTPCLLIHSKNDAAVPIGHAQHAHETIKNSELLVLDNKWGHLFWIGEDSAKPIEETDSFFSR